MKIRHAVPLLAVAFTALAPAGALADEGWSGSANAGLAFVQRQAGVSSGGWADLLHSITNKASAGLEVGYIKLPGTEAPNAYPALGYVPGDWSYGTFSASAAFRVRGGPGARLHVLGTAGYYDLISRTQSQARPAQAGPTSEPATHQWGPGFSLGIGVSGSGLVSPGFQLRWHETLGPQRDTMDIVTFEAGLNFN